MGTKKNVLGRRERDGPRRPDPKDSERRKRTGTEERDGSSAKTGGTGGGDSSVEDPSQDRHLPWSTLGDIYFRDPASTPKTHDPESTD